MNHFCYDALKLLSCCIIFVRFNSHHFFINTVKLLVDNCKVVFDWIHHITYQIFCHYIVWIFVQNRMIYLSPEYIDHGFYLHFKIYFHFFIFHKNCVNFINFKPVFLFLWLRLIQIKPNSHIILGVIIAIFVFVIKKSF